MLSDNIIVSERLINGSIGTVEHLDRRSKQLRIAIYVKFDDSRAGNFLKIRGFVVSLRIVGLQLKWFALSNGDLG